MSDPFYNKDFLDNLKPNKDYPEFCDKDKEKKRIDICKECQFLTKSATCSICGCWMPLKARLPFFSCPKKKW
jgi:hypothetical protein